MRSGWPLLGSSRPADFSENDKALGFRAEEENWHICAVLLTRTNLEDIRGTTTFMTVSMM